MTPARFQRIENLRYAQKRLPALSDEIGCASNLDVTIPWSDFAALFGGGIRLKLSDHPQIIAAVRAEIVAQIVEVDRALREIGVGGKAIAS